MNLKDLFLDFQNINFRDRGSATVLGLTQDSRSVSSGWIFIAIRGYQKDGHDFLNEIIQRDPLALVVEDKSRVPQQYQGIVIEVQSSREALDLLAARFYDQPAQSLFCVGVTGTNGKTSVTYMVECLLNSIHLGTGVLGTVNHHFQKHIWESQLTTPDALTLHKRLSEFKALGARAVALEVSSHAISQHRVDQIPFDAVVFTNLTRDHLDYHLNMKNYFAEKNKLFTSILERSAKPSRCAIINIDDSWGSQIKVAHGAQVLTYGQGDSDLQFQILRHSYSGVEWSLKTPKGQGDFFIPLPGVHNVYNAVAAVGVALAAGASLEACRAALRFFKGVPGRLERIEDQIGGRHIFVDYAHTDDALRVVLQSLVQIRVENHRQNKIITVFGCGGDRDRGKRPLMMAAALSGSDHVVLTSDNPRTEDPQRIMDDCMAQVDSSQKRLIDIVIDRKLGIETALRIAKKGDVVLVAGKGHENYQILGTDKKPFSDREVIETWLQHQKN